LSNCKLGLMVCVAWIRVITLVMEAVVYNVAALVTNDMPINK